MTARTPFLCEPNGSTKKKRKIRTLALLCFMIMGTGACGYTPSYKKVPAKPPPEHLRKPLETHISIQDARDLAKPAKKSDGFGETPHITIGDNPDYSTMKGLNTTSLFTEKLSNNEARFDRLEAAVDDLHTEFKNIKPAIDHLMSIEKDMNALMRQLQIVINNQNNNKQITTTKSAPVIQTADLSTDISISHMRIADHSDKTRLVLETSHNISYSISLDPDDNTLTLSFDKSHIGFSTSGLAKNSQLIDMVKTTEDESGSKIIITLNRASTILRQGRLPPSADKPYHRIFIDLKR